MDVEKVEQVLKAQSAIIEEFSWVTMPIHEFGES